MTTQKHHDEAERLAGECAKLIMEMLGMTLVDYRPHTKGFIGRLIAKHTNLANLLAAQEALAHIEASDVMKLNPLRKELAVIKESRAVSVDQEQLSRNETNRLRAELNLLAETHQRADQVVIERSLEAGNLRIENEALRKVARAAFAILNGPVITASYALKTYKEWQSELAELSAKGITL